MTFIHSQSIQNPTIISTFSRETTIGGDLQWLFTKEEYNSIAASKGSTEDKELYYRYKATGLVQAIGMSLKLPQTCIAMAQIFVHRFYVRTSFSSYLYQKTAPTVIFLVSKLEEQLRKPSDIIQATHHILSTTEGKFGNLDDFFGKGKDLTCEETTITSNDDFIRLQNEMFSLEKIILQMICFDLNPELPYKHLLTMAKFIPSHNDSSPKEKQLGESPPPPKIESASEEIIPAAWLIVNDSFRRPICLQYQAKSIAATAIVYAAERRSNIPLDELFDKNTIEAFQGNEDSPLVRSKSDNGAIISIFGCPYKEITKIMHEFDLLYGGGGQSRVKNNSNYKRKL